MDNFVTCIRSTWVGWANYAQQRYRSPTTTRTLASWSLAVTSLSYSLLQLRANSILTRIHVWIRTCLQNSVIRAFSLTVHEDTSWSELVVDESDTEILVPSLFAVKQSNQLTRISRTLPLRNHVNRIYPSKQSSLYTQTFKRRLSELPLIWFFFYSKAYNKTPDVVCILYYTHLKLRKIAAQQMNNKLIS